jgi:hypothetical protein
MALDYTGLRNTLDSGSQTLFRSQLANEFGKATESSFNDYFKNYSTYNTSAKKSAAVNTLKSSISTSFSNDVSKYVTSSDLNKYIDTFLSSFQNSSTAIKAGKTSAFQLSSNFLTSGLNYASNAKDIFSGAANQKTVMLNTTGLTDIFKNSQTQNSFDKDQLAYRKILAQNLSDFYTQAGFNQTSIGQAFTGDARFQENATKETLTNLANSLGELQKGAGNDRIAGELQKLVQGSLSSGMISQDLGKYFSDPTALFDSFDTLDKSAMTLQQEALVKQQADDKAAAEAAQAKATQDAAIRDKSRALLKRNPSQLSQSLALASALRSTGTSGASSGPNNSSLGQLDKYGK